MKCPVDGEVLVISERQGVEIDYCPKCRGVWLDRGELDKIIDQAAGAMVLPDPTPAPEVLRAPEPRVWQEPYRQEAGRPKRRRYDDDDYEPRSEKPRKKSRHYRKRKNRFGDFLEDLFDFD